MCKRNQKENKWYVIYPLLLIFLIYGCGTDNGSNEDARFEDGISREVKNLVGEDFLDVIENELDVPIHRGENPPDIVSMLSNQGSADAVVLMKPFQLHETNVPNDDPNEEYDALYLRFSNQDMEDYTLDFENAQAGNAPFVGRGSYIIGNGNSFTLFGRIKNELEDGTTITAQIFSGVITEDGISSAYHSFIMIDNDDIEGKVDNGTGRSFKDGDGLAENSSWPETGKRVLSKLTTMTEKKN